MRIFIIYALSTLFLFNPLIYAQTMQHNAITQPIPIHEITGFENYPDVVKQLIIKATSLTNLNLTYLYGSNNPKNNGMDCSGTINYLLAEAQVKDVPRDSTDIYKWVERNGKFHAVNSNQFNSSEFADLKPGDLLFWTGTYHVNRNPPISHVMLYIGKNQQGEPLMFGASDGRTYQNKQMWGVSVFDFKLPNDNSVSRFIGYSCIPGLTCNL